MQHHENPFYLLSDGKVQDLYELASPQGKDISGKKGQPVFLVPFRSLSLQRFTFPFSDISQIRNALELKVRPFSPAGNPLQVLPTITSRTGRETNGISWFISGNELDALDNEIRSFSTQRLIWPSALPLAAEIGREGGGLWADGTNVCSMLFSDGLPVLYAWKPRKSSSIDNEEKWLLDYSRNAGISVDNLVIVDLARGRDELERYLDMAKKVLHEREAFRSVNLSRAMLDTELYLEKASRYLTRSLAAVLLVGLLALGSAFYRYSTFNSTIDDIREMGITVYREVFQGKGEVIDPVSQARSRLSALQEDDHDGDPQEVLGNVGKAFLSMEGEDIVLDILRYSKDGADISGRSGEVALVQSFQRELSGLGLDPQIADIQQIPGGGLRFSLTIRWR